MDKNFISITRRLKAGVFYQFLYCVFAAYFSMLMGLIISTFLIGDFCFSRLGVVLTFVIYFIVASVFNLKTVVLLKLLHSLNEKSGSLCYENVTLKETWMHTFLGLPLFKLKYASDWECLVWNPLVLGKDGLIIDHSYLVINSYKSILF